MEAFKFLKEEIRFCKEQEGCVDCEINPYCHFLHRPRNLTNDLAERHIFIIENWSKEHPIITNARKFKEVFGDKAIYAISSPNVQALTDWWDEPYKEPKDE